MKKWYVSVCKNVVLSNLKHGKNEPPLRISHGKHGKPDHRHNFEFNGRARVIYDPKNPMPWGARAWVEIDD